MSLYLLGWCLCQDKPYGNIILTTITFHAYNDNYKLWGFISLYIWSPKKISYRHHSMFNFFGCFDIVIILYFREFCMLYNVWLSLWHNCDITIILFSFITNYPIRFFIIKCSIKTESRISKEKEHFTSYQFAINQAYKKETNQKWTNFEIEYAQFCCSDCTKSLCLDIKNKMSVIEKSYNLVKILDTNDDNEEKC